MNEILYTDLHKEIGELGEFRLKIFANWLNDTPYDLKQHTVIRIAPSIITRSEAEIFNMSIPRFAYRLYLSNFGNSIVNIRRLASFCDQARLWSDRISGKKDQNPQIKIDYKTKYVTHRHTPAKLLWKNHCIADCVLQIPNRLKNKYHIIQTELGRIYGELNDVNAVPFIRHIELAGGGMCAQAVCFMATVLLHQYAKNVLGMAEITYIAQEIKGKELVLSGLWHDEINRYFVDEKVGLNAVWQTPLLRGSKYDLKTFEVILRAYIRSNFPIIIPIDMGRAAGNGNDKHPILREESIYASNLNNGKEEFVKYAELLYERAIGKQDHCVLIVGNGTGKRACEFIINDSATMPFLNASTQQLADARCYDNNGIDLGNLIFLPITPDSVKLPLGQYFSLDEMVNVRVHAQKGDDTYAILRNPSYGLIDLSEAVQDGLAPKDYPKMNSEKFPGEFILINTREVVEDSTFLEERLLEPFKGVNNSIILNFLSSCDKWCWIQYADACFIHDIETNVIWIWDAEKTPLTQDKLPTFDAAMEYLLGIFVKTSDGWERIESTKQYSKKSSIQQKDNHNHKKINEDFVDLIGKSNIKFKKSLITSFSVKGLKDSVRLWPDNSLKNLDLYAFMQSDAENFIPETFRFYLAKKWKFLRYTNSLMKMNKKLKNAGEYAVGVISPLLSARYRMAKLSNKQEHIQRVADCVDKECKKSDLGLKVVAITSYLPGLASDSRLGNNSVKALAFLINMARQLKIRNDHPVSVIEIVAGSLIDGIWPGKLNDGEKVHVANLLSREDALDNVINNVLPFANTLKSNNIKLALELEPGPLFILNDLKAIYYFNKLLNKNKYESLRSILCLNIDIAHWSLESIQMNSTNFESNTTIVKNPDAAEIKSMIVQGHVSGHSAGHFSDLSLPRSDKPQNIDNWIASLYLLFSRIRMKDDSFYLSLELEAATSEKFLNESLQFGNYGLLNGK
ncbi:MAG: hypothetical protein JW870_12720 [Candidatus Delongbacteria bacterium]|nr:hypothetical protein [Candidatus Delongbacteria bacterium]